MAKKLVKKRRSIPLGLLIIIFFFALFVYDIAYHSTSGGTTLVEWNSIGGGLALWSFILLKYLEGKNVGGDRWKKHLKVGSWVMMSLVGLFVLWYLSLSDTV